MREGSPSTTAQLVALARAVYTASPSPYRVASDPLAERFLPLPLALLARAFTGAWRAPRLAHGVVRALGLGFAEHVALRTAAIDTAVREAVADGARQLVILGAGLDARAYRMPELADVTVFEVDHPSTQAFKRARIGAVKPCAREVRFVAVDFERERLDDVLAASGHDTKTPSVWLWEGVTVYLAPEAARATIDVVASRSCEGSAFLITYAPPEMLDRTPGIAAFLRSAGRIVGEPVRWSPTREELAETLRTAGFDVVTDESAPEWTERYWSATGERPRAWERLAVARRRQRRGEQEVSKV